MQPYSSFVVPVALFLAGLLLTFAGFLINLRNRVEKHESKLGEIENDHKAEISALVAGHTALRETVGGIQLEIAKGFARIEEQIKTLFRDQEKHS